MENNEDKELCCIYEKIRLILNRFSPFVDYEIEDYQNCLQEISELLEKNGY